MKSNERKVIKRIAEGFLCVAIVLTIINMPGNVKVAYAAFDSYATAASEDATLSDVMTPRLDGEEFIKSSAEASACNIKVTKGEDDTEYLYVQGKDGATDWVYSKKIVGDEVVYSEDIKSAKSLSEIDLRDCKIWIEKTIDDVTYANEINATGEHSFSVNGTCACGLIQVKFEVINEDDKTVKVTGLNDSCRDMTHDLFIPSTVKINGEDYSVTEIAEFAFKNRMFDGKLVIGNRVKKIGKEAFSGGGFKDNLIIPDSVTEIGDRSFEGCNFTGEVVIPNSVTTIGAYVFSSCNNIESISIPCTMDPSTELGINNSSVTSRDHDFSNGKCNLCGACQALLEYGKHVFNDEFICTNCGQIDQFGVYFSKYKDLVTVENDENYLWDMDSQYIVPGNVDSNALSSMTITAKKRVKLSFSYSFDNAPNGGDMLVIKRRTKDWDYEEGNERYPSHYNGEYPYDDDNRDPLILYPGDTLQIDYKFGSEYKDEGIKLGEFKIEEITYVEIKEMSLELDPAYGAYIGVNLYIDASDNATLYLDDVAVTPDGKAVKLIRDDNAGIYKLQYRCAVKDFAMRHSLVAYDSGGNTIGLSLDQYTDVEEYTYSGKSYCNAVLAEGANYSDELKAICSALIEFNKQTRNYFKYDNDDLNVGKVTADIPTTGYESSMTGKLPEGCSYVGSSLLLKDELVLRHYFTGDIRITDYRKCYNKTQDVWVASEWDYKSDELFSYVDIAAPYSNVGDMYELILGNGDDAFKLTYGVLTYCKKAYDQNPNSDLVNTCNAMYNYSKATEEYFGNH